MILLDTMLIAEAIRRQPMARVTSWLNEQAAETLYVASVSLAALVRDVALLPAEKQVDGWGVGVGEALAELFEGRVLAFDTRAALSYGALMRDVRRRGESVSRSNGLVAAVARSYGMPVAALDVRPFWVAGCQMIQVGRG